MSDIPQDGPFGGVGGSLRRNRMLTEMLAAIASNDGFQAYYRANPDLDHIEVWTGVRRMALWLLKRLQQEYVLQERMLREERSAMDLIERPNNKKRRL